MTMPDTQLTPRQKSAISAIIASKTRIALEQEAQKEDISALAIELNLKPAACSKLISLIMREQAKGAVIEEEQKLLDLAEQVFDEMPEPAEA